MSPFITEIYKRSEPYWQVRSNDLHVPACFEYAKQLLMAYPECDREIVLAAILMHDNGYMKVPPETLLMGLKDAPVGYDGNITRLHEIAGVELAREMLHDLDYDPLKSEQILSIIDGHDSRIDSISAEDELVKDADKLWRFCTDGVRIASGWMNLSTDEFLTYVESKIERWFFTAAAKRMAHDLAAKTRQELIDV